MLGDTRPLNDQEQYITQQDAESIYRVIDRKYL